MQAMQGLWRLTWKEYRVQRSLWLAVLILTTLIQFLVTLVLFLTNGEPIPSSGHLVIAFMGTAVYMLGCGATLFALEHETGTFDFQRLLPVRAWQLYAAKFGLGFGSGILLLVALVILSQALFAHGQATLSLSDWLAGCVNFTEVFLWAALFSLLIRHPLRAAVSGIFAMSISVCIVLPFTSSIPWEPDALLYHRSFLGTRIGIIGLLFVIDTWLTGRWMQGRIGLPSWWPRRVSRATDIWLVPAAPIPAYVAASPIGWGRLVGITWRQGWWLLLIPSGIFLWAFVRAFLAVGVQRTAFASQIIPLITASACVYGLCAFTLDQWSYQFRFYAERGVSPRWLWLSRHVVWFTPVLVQATCVQLLMPPVPSRSPIDAFLNRFGVVIIAGIVYAVSQFCAMFIRSSLVAFVVSIFAGVLSWCWIALMLVGGIPLWWSVLPVPIVAMAVTWFFSLDWIEERRNRRHWTQVALAIGIPSLLISLGGALYRAYEIPLVDPGFSVAEFTRPMALSEQETLGIYAQADRLIVEQIQSPESLPMDSQSFPEESTRKWLSSALPALPLLERAHERPAVPLTLVQSTSQQSDSSVPDYLGNYNPKSFLLLARLQAESLTRDGKPGEAWRCYEIALELLKRFRMRADELLSRLADFEEHVLLDSIVRWAASPQQSTERLTVALAKLEGLESQESNDKRLAKIQHIAWSEFLGGDIRHSAWLGLQPYEAKTMAWLNAFMPWERTRSLRMLHLYTLAQLEPAAAEQHWQNWQTDAIETQQRTMSLFARSRRYPDDRLVLHRHAARVLVALCDWQHTHGKLPETLAELVGPYFRELPLDPMTQQPFIYFPRGIEEEMKVPGQLSGTSPLDMPRATPFLWSPDRTGMALIRNLDGKLGIHAIGRDIPLAEGIAQGLVWRIPTAGERRAERRTSNAEHRTLNIELQTSTFDVRRSMFDVRRSMLRYGYSIYRTQPSDRCS